MVVFLLDGKKHIKIFRVRHRFQEKTHKDLQIDIGGNILTPMSKIG